jgi:hypothetical protein
MRTSARVRHGSGSAYSKTSTWPTRDAFNERTLRLFPTHSRNPSDIAVLEYTGVRVWFYGDGKVRIQPKTESADVALRRIGRSRGLEVEDR